MQVLLVMFALVVVVVVHADVYLHNPPGSNNRLNGNRRERNKNGENNRLMDDQNNDRGGYNVGQGEARNRGLKEGGGTLSYVEGSKLSIQWTNQHECGGANTHCDVILQYMNDKGVRDGTAQGKPLELDNQGNVRRTNRGRHEDQFYYKDCKDRARDTNLYTADQKLKNADARSTRQNPNGDRSGLECPEERDYYPYHAPSPWKDIAIFTNNMERCTTLYQQQSQNVVPKGYCKGATTAKQPIDETVCKTNGGSWFLARSHGLPAPECLEAPFSRDNHLGNTGTPGKVPLTLAYDWTIPPASEGAFVLRIRYNISTHDYEQFDVNAELNNQKNDDAGGPSLAQKYGFSSADEAEDRGYVVKNNPTLQPFEGALKDFDFQMAFNTAQTGRTFQDRTHKFFIQNKDSKDAPIHNLNVIGKRGNIVQVYPAVEYGFEPAVLTVNQGDYIHAHWTGSLNNPGNNDGQGARGTDKSNIIAMTDRKWELAQGAEDLADTIGLPGNSYPLSIDKGTFLDVDKTTAKKLALPKERRRRNGDQAMRSVDVQDQRPKVNEIKRTDAEKFWEDEELLDQLEAELTETPESVRVRRSLDSSVLNNIVHDIHKVETEMKDILQGSQEEVRGSEENDDEVLGESEEELDEDEDDDDEVFGEREKRGGGNNAAELDQSPAKVDVGLIEAKNCKTYNYMCTRNNNFSNRSQKGKVVVNCGGDASTSTNISPFGGGFGTSFRLLK